MKINRTADWIFGNNFVVIGTTAPSARLVIMGNLSVNNTDGTSRLFVDTSTGNVGIGTTGPSGELEIVDSGTNSQTYGYITTYNDQTVDYGPFLSLRKSHSDVLGTKTATIDTEELGSIEFRGVDTNAVFLRGVKIVAVQNGAAGASNVPTNLVFETDSGSGTNTNVLVLGSNGNVGIGTTNPSEVLDIEADSAELIVNSTGTDGAQISLANTAGGAGITSPGSWVLKARGTGGALSLLYNKSDSLEYMTIASNGNVGIGTTSPGAKLEVNGGNILVNSTNANLFVDSTGTWSAMSFRESGTAQMQWFYDGTNNELNLRDNANSDASIVVFEQSGNVGIGTTAPAAPLHIYNVDSFNSAIILEGTGNRNYMNKITQYFDGNNPTTNSQLVFNVSSSSSGGSQQVMILYGNKNVTVKGDLKVEGTLSKGGGTFRIDHPLDPLNKELYHSFVESPEMMNIYKGNSKTIKGRAEIKMADWFAALNGNITDDYSFSITPLNSFCGEYYVDNKDIASRGAFEVFTKNDCEFSYVVYAVRHDRWAEANRVQVEAIKDKPGYIYPQLWEK